MLGDMTTNGTTTGGLGGWRGAHLSPLNWYGDLADKSTVDSAWVMLEDDSCLPDNVALELNRVPRAATLTSRGVI
jgi:hypothetical protein